VAQVPREREAEMLPFLTELEAAAPVMGITDIQLSLTSLVGEGGTAGLPAVCLTSLFV
jgi:hypothetical protein